MTFKVEILACKGEIVSNPDKVKCALCKKVLRRGDVIVAEVTMPTVESFPKVIKNTRKFIFCGSICYRTWDTMCERQIHQVEGHVATIDGGIPDEWDDKE